MYFAGTIYVGRGGTSGGVALATGSVAARAALLAECVPGVRGLLHLRAPQGVDLASARSGGGRLHMTSRQAAD